MSEIKAALDKGLSPESLNYMKAFGDAIPFLTTILWRDFHAIYRVFHEGRDDRVGEEIIDQAKTGINYVTKNLATEVELAMAMVMLIGAYCGTGDKEDRDIGKGVVKYCELRGLDIMKDIDAVGEYIDTVIFPEPKLNVVDISKR